MNRVELDQLRVDLQRLADPLLGGSVSTLAQWDEIYFGKMHGVQARLIAATRAYHSPEAVHFHSRLVERVGMLAGLVEHTITPLVLDRRANRNHGPVLGHAFSGVVAALSDLLVIDPHYGAPPTSVGTSP